MHYAASTCCMRLYGESLVVAAEGLLKRGFFNAWCMPMASAREQICPRIAAKNLALAFPAAYGRVSLKRLAFQTI